MENESTSKNTKGNAAIMIIVLVVFGLVLAGFGLYRYNIGRESSHWPSVKGTITHAHAQSHKVKKGHHYLPSLKYTYSVNGSSYTGRRITASDEYQKTLGGAKDILRRYPVGGEVRVYYDPADAGTSLLEVGVKKNVFILLGGAALCLVSAGAIIVSVLKTHRSR